MFASILYSYLLWTSQIYTSPSDGKNYCVPSLSHRQFQTVAGNIDSIITLLLPFFIISFLNIRIVVAMLYHFQGRQPHTEERRVFHTRLNGTENTISSLLESVADNSVTSNRNRTQIRITKMLILVSTAFLILNLPSHAIRIYMFVMKIRQREHLVSKSAIMWQQIAQVHIREQYI